MKRYKTIGTGFLLTGLFAVAHGQSPVPVPGTNTSYYPSKMSPAPAGLMPPTSVRPSEGTPGVPTWHVSPASTQGQPKTLPVEIAKKTDAPAPVVEMTSPIRQVVASDLPAITPPSSTPPATPAPVVTPPVMTPAPVVQTPPLPSTAPTSPSLPGITPPAATAPTPGTTPAPSTAVPFTPPQVVIESTPAPTTVIENNDNKPRPLMLSGTPSSPIVPPTQSNSVVPAGALSAKHATGVIVETVAPESVSVGQDCTYELVVRNDGTAAIWNVRVEDEVPTSAKYVLSDPPADQANGRLSWTVGALDAGASRRIKVTIRPSEEGELRNRAVVTFAAATEGKMKVTRPKLAMSVAGPDTAKAGEEVAFTIKISNSGSGPATNMVVQARLSDGLHNSNGSTLELKLPSLAAGQTKTIPLKAVATKAGAQVCSVTTVADGTATEPSKSNVNIVEPKLTAKILGPAKCNVKAEPVFTLEFTNPGTASTDPLTITAVVPTGYEFLQASDGGMLAPNGKDVQWRLSGMPAGAGKAVSMKLKSVAPTDSAIRVLAAATSEQANNVNTGNVTQVGAVVRGLEAKAELAVKSEGVPALRFEVIDIEDPVEVGKEAIYEIKVTNQGTGACTNVTIVGFPAEGTTPVASNGPTQIRVQAGQLLFDPITKLDVKGEAIYRVRVKGNAAGDLKFKVQVSCDQIRTPIIKEENTRFFKE